MKNHVFRPLLVVIGLVAVVLIARLFIVPKDFGVWERGYMYGWHRKSNEDDWKAVKVKFQGREYCKDCHSTQYSQISTTPHFRIQCENCHGPAIDHPSDPPKLNIDRRRDLCIRCHSYLPYPTSIRSKIKGINPDEHNPGIECVTCHNPHKASKPI
ncbi:MAG: cytochrome c3 family protein [Nitrospirae bacterium]|nr:cytochrome c3 family protein [Nitrospirota bacterium]MDA8338321.1 cytochrome c3 family protein [Nitrospiraceae bacterium]